MRRPTEVSHGKMYSTVNVRTNDMYMLVSGRHTAIKNRLQNHN